MNLRTHIREDLWQTIANAYEAENYSHAILDAIHYLSDVLREKSGLDGDGVSLVGQALGQDPPKLRVNKLQTETERNVQKGLQHILMGLYRGIRNPRSHELIEDTKDTADAVIYFIDYLLGILAESEEPFTIPSFLSMILDPQFVPSPRYAELLASEIPARKRTETLIELYRRKQEADPTALGLIVKAILKLLSEDQIDDFLAVVSDDLKTTRDREDIGVVLQILPPDLWTEVDEAARLRTENRLVSSIDEGEYDSHVDEVNTEGALGAWAVDFVAQFSSDSVSRLEEVLTRKLEAGNSSERDYVFQFFISLLPLVFETPAQGKRCANALLAGIMQEPWNRQALLDSYWSYPDDWRHMIRIKTEKSDPDFGIEAMERVYATLESEVEVNADAPFPQRGLTSRSENE